MYNLKKSIEEKAFVLDEDDANDLQAEAIISGLIIIT